MNVVHTSVVLTSNDPVVQYIMIGAVVGLAAIYSVKALALWVWGKIQRAREKRQ